MGYQIDQIIADYGPLISRIAATYEADPVEQKDLVQEVLLAVWQGLSVFKGEASLKTYVARIAHYRGVDHVRRHSNKPKSQPLDDSLVSGAKLEEIADKNLKLQKLLSEVRQLPLPLRQVATLALEGFEAREIADSLGLTPNNAAVRLNRAKATLKEVMSK